MPKTEIHELARQHLATVALMKGLGAADPTIISNLLDLTVSEAEQTIKELEAMHVIHRSEDKYLLRVSPLDPVFEEEQLQISYRDYLAWGMSLLLGEVSINRLASTIGDTILETLARFGKACVAGWVSFKIKIQEDQLFVSTEYFRSLGFSKLVSLLAKIYPFKAFFLTRSEAKVGGARQSPREETIAIGLKAWLGILSLRVSTPLKEAMRDLSQIIQFLTDSRVAEDLSFEDSLSLLALLSLTDDWDISLDLDEVSVKLPRNEAMLSELSELLAVAQLQEIDRVLPGLVKYLEKKGEIPLRKVGEFVSKGLEKNSNIKGADKFLLGLLAYSSALEGIITDDHVLIVERVLSNIMQLSPLLLSDEYVVLGGILGFEDPSLSKLARILSVEKTKIEGIVHSLSAKLNLDFVISPSGAIKIPENVEIPIFATRANLPRDELIVLGFLISFSPLSFEELQKRLKNIREDPEIIVLKLIGKGIIHALIDEKAVHFITVEQEEEAILRFPFQLSHYEEKIMKYFSSNLPPIDLGFISEQLEVPFSTVVETTFLLVGLGAITNILFEDFVLKQFTVQKGVLISFNQCVQCGAETDSFSAYCSACSNAIIVCGICKGAILEHSNADRCEACLTSFHNAHLSQWLKINPKCPICRRVMPLERRKK